MSAPNSRAAIGRGSSARRGRPPVSKIAARDFPERSKRGGPELDYVPTAKDVARYNPNDPMTRAMVGNKPFAYRPDVLRNMNPQEFRIWPDQMRSSSSKSSERGVDTAMSFTDLSNIADQAAKLSPQRSQQPPPQEDPAKQAPDPKSFQPAPPTNPVSALQTAVPPPQIPTGLRDEAKDDAEADKPGWWRAASGLVSNFMPATPDQDPGQWGQKPWQIAASEETDQPDGGPYMPSPRESYGVIGSRGASLAQTGAPAVAGPAGIAAFLSTPFAPILDGLSRGHFSQNFTAANMRALQIQQNQMLLQNEEAVRNHNNMIVEASSIFAQAHEGALSPDQTYWALHDWGQRHNYAGFLNVLENKGPAAARRYLAQQDAVVRDLWGAGTSLRKAVGGESDAQTASHWGESGAGATSVESGTFPSLPGEGRQQPAAPETPTRGGDFTSNLVRQQKLTPQELEAAQGLVNREPTALYGDLAKAKNNKAAQIKAKVDHAADTIHSEINRIAGDRGQTQEQKLEALGQIVPGKAGLLSGLLDYSIVPERDIPAAGGEREHLISLARQINPNWKPGNARIAQKYHDPNSREGLIVQRTGSLAGSLFSVNSAALRIPLDSKITTNQINDLIANRFTGDPRWVEYYSAIRNVAQEVVAIETGGKPAVTLVNNMVKHMMQTANPAQILAQIQVDVRSAYGFIKPLREQWRQEIGDPKADLPFLSKSNDAALRAYLRSNPYRGLMPSDAPASLRAVSRPKGEPKPSWLTKDMDWEPLTEDDVKRGRMELDIFEKGPNRNDPKEQAKAQRIRKRLGIFADPDE